MNLYWHWCNIMALFNCIIFCSVHMSYRLNTVPLQKPRVFGFFFLPWLTYRWPLQPLLYYFWPYRADTERKRAIARGRKQPRGGIGQLCSWVHVSSSAWRSGITELPRESSLTCSARLNSQSDFVFVRVCYLSAAMSCHRLPHTSCISHLFESVLTFSFTRSLSCQRSNVHEFSAMRSVASA